MTEGIPRISVYIITYNQEDVIDRTLASILCQREYVYEICISDDCSTDRTWEILQEYSCRYPGLFKLNRNDPNVGIFENTERVWSMVTGDIAYDLAGDDEVGEGYFKAILDFINEEQIDYKNELFCIYGDYLIKYPNGDSIVLHNSNVNEYQDAFTLALRGRICNRSACYNRRMIERFDRISQGRSHKVEHIQDRQLQLNTEKNYYIPFVGNIYYASIGISAHIDEKIRSERLEIWPFTMEYLSNKGVELSQPLINCIKFNIIDGQYRYGNKTISGFFKRIWYYYASKDHNLPRKVDHYEMMVFALLRRFPHKKPICFK